MPAGAIESVTTGLITTIRTDLESITTGFKVKVDYPHEKSQIPYGVYVNLIDMTHEEFGIGQRYKTNKIQLRKLLYRISIYTPKKTDTTLYSDGTGTSCETQWIDRIIDRIQRRLITKRDLDMTYVSDVQLRGVSPLLFDENLNAFSKTISVEVEFEEIV